MENFSDKQNEIFGKLFGELKKRNPSFKTQAHTLIEFDDDNFKRLYLDPDNEIIGTDEEIKLCTDRAKYLEII